MPEPRPDDATGPDAGASPASLAAGRLLGRLAEEVPGVTSVVLVSSDGLQLATAGTIDRTAADSVAALTSGLLGDQYLGIEPGAQEKMYAGGDEIKQTQSAVVLESLISQFLFSKAADAGNSSAPAAAASSGGKK